MQSVSNVVTTVHPPRLGCVGCSSLQEEMLSATANMLPALRPARITAATQSGMYSIECNAGRGKGDGWSKQPDNYRQFFVYMLVDLKLDL